MKIRFKEFESITSLGVEIQEVGEVDTYTLVYNFKKIRLDEDDLKIFLNSSKTKTFFEVKSWYEGKSSSTDIYREFKDLEELLSKCNCEVKHLNGELPSYWVDMGNGLNTIVIEDENAKFSTYNIYSGENELNEYLRTLEETLQLDLDARRYNL